MFKQKWIKTSCKKSATYFATAQKVPTSSTRKKSTLPTRWTGSNDHPGSPGTISRLRQHLRNPDFQALLFRTRDSTPDPAGIPNPIKLSRLGAPGAPPNFHGHGLRSRLTSTVFWSYLKQTSFHVYDLGVDGQGLHDLRPMTTATTARKWPGTPLVRSEASSEGWEVEPLGRIGQVLDTSWRS